MPIILGDIWIYIVSSIPLLFSVSIIPIILYWRYKYDKRLIARYFQEKGGKVETIRLQMRAIRSEYEVTYYTKEGERRFGTCILRGRAIYWSSDQVL
jgi:hypothetical protein